MEIIVFRNSIYVQISFENILREKKTSSYRNRPPENVLRVLRTWPETAASPRAVQFLKYRTEWKKRLEKTHHGKIKLRPVTKYKTTTVVPIRNLHDIIPYGYKTRTFSIISLRKNDILQIFRFRNLWENFNFFVLFAIKSINTRGVRRNKTLIYYLWYVLYLVYKLQLFIGFGTSRTV